MLIVILAGCFGNDDETSGVGGEAAPAAGDAVPAELLEKTWQYRMVDPAARARFEGNAGWASFFNRSYDETLGAFGDAEPVGRARVHLEHAALYRQALLLYANAAHHVYGGDRQPFDPVEADYLRGVSEWLRGDKAAAEAALAALPATVDAAVPPRAAAWKAAIAGAWPPALDAAAFPGPSAGLDPKILPRLEGLPHYAFAEQGEPIQAGSGRKVESTDPTAIYLLSRWHEQAALQLAPGTEALQAQLLAPWRLPAEPDPGAELLPAEDADAWLFAGFPTTLEDVAFLADASAAGIEAVARWQGKSVLAAAIAPAIADGQVVPDIAMEQAAKLQKQLVKAMEARAGQPEGYHGPFAALAAQGALRAAMLAADANDQYRDAGILRLNALDQAQGPALDPVFSLSVAAWDAGNRNPLRAQEIVHDLLARFPAIAAARYPLDALHIRLGRSQVSSSPVP